MLGGASPPNIYHLPLPRALPLPLPLDENMGLDTVRPIYIIEEMGIQTVTERERGEKKIFLLVPFHRIL
jgi:hypothetical protein